MHTMTDKHAYRASPDDRQCLHEVALTEHCKQCRSAADPIEGAPRLLQVGDLRVGDELPGCDTLEAMRLAGDDDWWLKFSAFDMDQLHPAYGLFWIFTEDHGGD